ncbi:MAG: LLM class flavin-dependent oxidoreductase [Actinomycetia bacterium]|nr:LLM class flavin-dependent oxidoreductase [Actinomycetes bacterium]MCP4222861.1 LLM class flavin-dependent oxidoreductase [Actinomycetes bacterium]MCP5033565.1 LLM class flavin-dependent oxidoreductase [Actinomycetes bacterium]
MTEFWTLGVASLRRIGSTAERVEAAGWDGLGVVDSQNLSGDCYVALAIAASHTRRLKLATAVTNPITRHPAVTAAAIASVHFVSGGRAVLGIGRGDSALAHLGRAPARVADFERYLKTLQAYLAGASVPFDELAFSESVAPPVDSLALAHSPGTSTIGWLPGSFPKVEVEVAATGPKVLAAAARHADRVVLGLGADPERVAWAIEHIRQTRVDAGLDPDTIEIGSYVNVAPHNDLATARDLVRGGLSTFARFSIMHGEVASPASSAQREVLEQVHREYDMTSHTKGDSAQATGLPDAFVDSMAVVGPVDHCIDRLRELLDLGVTKLMFALGTSEADPEAGALSQLLVTSEVIPALRS